MFRAISLCCAVLAASTVSAQESIHLASIGGRVTDPSGAVIEGAALRVRPKIMTASAIFLGLLPIMWSQGTGADVMKRIAAPMIGGMVTATILTLLVIPALFLIWKKWELGLKART